ncbi:uncharacterized protein CMC5_078190 [Chondromyces crocatus]|uniref:Uncharacterized protein n=2 Tax=Chondromyces crocatus TaxID=52 RepID=A0A0K1ERW3_CHOCO|nr:uncharacterized protein CMC5_078190 [Chondromyces crocatus]
MNGTLLVQAYLLATLRASDLVEAACRRLGLDSFTLKEYKAEAARRGFDQPGHPMSNYIDLLGEPLSREHVEDKDRYRRCRFTYALPLWPELVLVVYGSKEGQSAGVDFAGRRSVKVPPTISMVHPWHLVDEQMVDWPGLRVVDEWYPMKDYEVLIQVDDGSWARHFLLFDHGLLQEVSRG